jgi:hypothetical protein
LSTARGPLIVVSLATSTKAFAPRHRPMASAARGKLRRFVTAIGSLAALIASGPSHAADAVRAKPSVTVVYDSAAPEAAAAVRAIASHLEGLDVSVAVEPVEAEGAVEWLQRTPSSEGDADSVGQFYVDAVPGGDLLVYFTEPGGASSLVRRIRPKQATARVALEEAGIVVRSLLEGILDGGRVGVALPAPRALPEPPAPALPPPPRPPPPPSGKHLAIAIRYVGTSFLSGQGLQSGAYFGLRAYPWSTLTPVALGVGYTAFYPSRVDFSSSQISVQRRPIELGVSFASRGRLGLLAEVMLVGDFVSRTTIQTGPNLERTEPRGRWAFGLSARGGACFSPSLAQHWCLSAGLDAFLNELSYVVSAPEAADRVSSPRLRPRVDAGLTFDFL